ncbi:MAG: peptidoglycan binding domain-containing protein [Eubacteriales bacterium]|nr:peptidoglycan binding domain-containing protein [Eubacteriales bacterium]
MGDKKRKGNRKIHSDADDDFQIISDDELFEDVDDYDEEAEIDDDFLDEESEYDEPDDESEYEDLEEDDYLDYEEFEDDELEESEEDELEEDFEEESAEEEKALKRRRRRKRIRIALISVVGILAVAYLGVSGYFYSHFYLNTRINGTDFSMSTAAQVQDYMEGQVADYSLTMKESDGGSETIDGSDISLKYVRDDSVEKLLKKQNPLLWVTALWETPEIEASIGVKYDRDKLNHVLGNLTCLKEEEQTPSVSARPVFKDTQFEIQEEQIGTQIDKEKFTEVVNTAISGFQTEIDLTEQGCYILPKYTSESPEVAEARDAMNSYLGANITLDFSPYTEVVDASVISQWITVDDNMQVTFNQDSVRSYIASLAEKYDTYGRSRTFTTGYGNAVQVDGGSYGWQIDQEAEYNALTANIQNAETITREPNYARRAATHEGNDFGNTYAEVDLTNQHMFYFKDGQCIMQSDIVTGNPNKGNATPQGVYSLAYKAMNQTLRGPKKEDGTYEWESPVTYWMPFNGGIGFHDANWQSAFGGSRYQTYGSHGCVNMPPAAAGELYSYIEAGIPVVCHY